jgi:hypothetical protein
MRPASLTDVHLGDRFWAPRLLLNRRNMLPAQYRLCADSGRIKNLEIAAGLKQGEFEGYYFNDSDVYKWIEAAAWSLASAPDPGLQALIDGLVKIIAAAQQPDGYLNSYFTGARAGLRFTNPDLHELYCAGHLIQAGIALQRSTGQTALLDVAIRFADLICATFGPEEQGKRFWACGHPEVEMALVELFRQTGETRYLEQADYFISARGAGKLGKPYDRHPASYHQDHLPFRKLERMEGHAVRAAYLNCGSADLFAETGEPALMDASERLWKNMTSRQMYIHGGIGARHENEGFGEDYELPNQSAYAETCAAISNLMWNWRLFLITGEGRFMDVLEQALFNNILAGMSLDGERYFYVNPLRDDGSHQRQSWFTCACCPSNLSRTLAWLPGILYSTTVRGVWINIYAASEAHLPLPDGRQIDLRMNTHYPWAGEVKIEMQTSGEYSVYLRVPGWCGSGIDLSLNGTPVRLPELTDGYIELRRSWTAGDRLALILPMPIRLVQSHPEVTENLGRVALMRGPLLYCLESADHPGLDVRRLLFNPELLWQSVYRPELLGGVIALEGIAFQRAGEFPSSERLYFPFVVQHSATWRQIPVTAIPYFAWANRSPGSMETWLRLS